MSRLRLDVRLYDFPELHPPGKWGRKPIVEIFVLRWNVEATFEETRRHMGVETQRRWRKKAKVESIRPWFCLIG